MSTHESRLKITLLEDVTRKARGISAAINGIEKQASSFMAPVRSLTGQLLAFGGSYIGVTEGYKATAGAAIEFESAFADVRKVVDANEEQFDNLRRSIRQMSNEIPLAANDIAALVAAAGESGIATNDLKTFAEMAARVGIAFDMGAADAGESLAKLKTQLGLSVAETGDMADAINHLSNNMASKAKDITDYMLRVGALAEMGGFAKEEIAGIGSAMIAAGAPAEVAGTAMQNVVKALTKGESAKKGQKDVAKALGLNLPQIAKDMQKDAPKAMRKVLNAIGKAPKDRHIALLSDFFGDEAKAFAPLIGNMGLLDQALDSVADKSKYAGSAFNEFVERSKTTQNTLDLLGNKISNRFWEMGDRMLPTIKEAASAMGYVVDTLDSRISVFDKAETSIQGFMQGLGYSGVREVIEDLGDLFFGKIDPTAGDQLGRLFMQAKDWGESIRELNAAIAANPIAQFLGDIAPYGLQIMAWGVGISFFAASVRKLAGALMFLSGASAMVGAFKVIKQLNDAIGGKGGGRGGGVVGGGDGGKGGGGKGPASRGPNLIGGFIGALAGIANYAALIDAIPTDAGEREKFMADNKKQWDGYNKWLEDNVGSPRSWFHTDNRPVGPETSSYMALENARNARAAGIGGSTTETLPGKTADDLGIVKPISLDAASIDAMTQPRGTQDVNVLNPPPRPSLTFHINLGGIHGITDPEAIANDVAQRVGQKIGDQVSGIYADTSYGVA